MQLFLGGITLSGHVILCSFNSTPLFSISTLFNIYEISGTSVTKFLNNVEFNKLHRAIGHLIPLVSLLYNINIVVLLIVSLETCYNFPDQLFCSRYNFSLEVSIQFANSSNCSYFTGENTETHWSVVKVCVSVVLTKKSFDQYYINFKFLSPDHQVISCLSCEGEIDHKL